ncbi:MAG: HAD family hydrolase [Candidatus Levyibacteriota bacterium]
MIKVVLFDFGGVIYEHPKAVIPEVLSRIYNVPLEKAVSFYNTYKDDYYVGNISSDALIEALSRDFGSNLATAEVKDRWMKYYGEMSKTNPEILELIKKVKVGRKVYLFSNTTEMSNAHNQNIGVYDLFDGLFMSFQQGVKKPNPEFYKKVLSQVGVSAGEVLFIDDSYDNLEPAKRLGIKTILFNILEDDPQQLSEQINSVLEA